MKYSERLAERLTDLPSNNRIVCGVSFGGVLAPYLAKHIQAKKCIIVSSMRSPNQCPKYLKYLCGCLRNNTPFLTIALYCTKLSCRIFYPILYVFTCFSTSFQTYESTIKQFISIPTNRAVLFVKLLMRWIHDTPLPYQNSGMSTYQIHGEKDYVLPYNSAKHENVILVKNGGHLLPMTNPNELNKILYTISIDSFDAVVVQEVLPDLKTSELDPDSGVVVQRVLPDPKTPNPDPESESNRDSNQSKTPPQIDEATENE